MANREPRRPAVFIGSSSESTNLIDILRPTLIDIIQLTSWTEPNVFDDNHSALHSLSRISRLFDFSIFILANDDLALHRGDAIHQARDNVIFELGLFLGATQRERAVIIAKQGITLPSDLHGIIVTKFVRSEGGGGAIDEESLSKIRGTIMSKVRFVNETRDYRALPSTAIAIAYVENFVKILGRQIRDHSNTRITGEDDLSLTIANFQVKLHIIIPEQEHFNRFNEPHDYLADMQLTRVTIENTSALDRVRTAYLRRANVQSLKDGADGTRLILYDVPTTLVAIRNSIQQMYHFPAVGATTEQRRVWGLELETFKFVLQQQLELYGLLDVVEIYGRDVYES